MSGPLVTLGVPVYRGQDILPVTLECVRTQTYQNLDVLISVDGADQASLEACRPFLSDPRFRVQLQESRLGWAGNTDWTMRHRRGAFYIYQQHDDQVSPTYVADLVEAAHKWPDAAICYSEMRLSGTQNRVVRARSTLGDPITRALNYMSRLDASALRGLIRGTALDRTAGLLANEFEGYGSDCRLLAELALAGEFRFVTGPSYYKRLHGENMHLKWYDWPEERKRSAWASLAAGMAEALVPAGSTLEDRWDLFNAVFERFVISRGAINWLRDRSRTLYKRDRSLGARLLLRIIDRLRSGGTFDALILPYTRPMFCQLNSRQDRVEIARAISQRLQVDGRFDPWANLHADWHAVRTAAIKHAGEVDE